MPVHQKIDNSIHFNPLPGFKSWQGQATGRYPSAPIWTDDPLRPHRGADSPTVAHRASRTPIKPEDPFLLTEWMRKSVLLNSFWILRKISVGPQVLIKHEG